MKTSLRSSLGVEVTPRVERRFPEGGGFYAVTVGYDLDLAQPDVQEAAIAKVEAAMTPPTREQCEDWLVMLQAALAGGKRSAVGANVALEMFAGALTRYPADVARKACMDLATRPRKEAAWFPTLPELIGECERHASPRESLLASLKAYTPPTEADRLDDLARDWALLAVRAEDDAIMTRRSDPDLSSEAAEFAAIARSEAKRLRVAAHTARTQ